MQEPFTLEVTQEDCQNGSPGNSRSCPVALALKRKFPYSDTIRVEPDWALLSFPGSRFYITAPGLSDFVHAVDLRERPSPRIFHFREYSYA